MRLELEHEKHWNDCSQKSLVVTMFQQAHLFEL